MSSYDDRPVERVVLTDRTDSYVEYAEYLSTATGVSPSVSLIRWRLMLYTLYRIFLGKSIYAYGYNLLVNIVTGMQFGMLVGLASCFISRNLI